MTEADFYKADQLKDITMNYCTKSMEALLEGGRLNELDQGMLRALTVYVRQKQDEKLHRSIASDRLAALVETHREFYDDLDIPPPSLHLIVNKVRAKKVLGPGVRSPPLLAQDSNRRRSTARFGIASPASPDALRPMGGSLSNRGVADDASEMFSMDEDEISTPRKDANARSQGSPWASLPQVAHLSLDDSVDKGTPTRPWKSRTVEAERKQSVVEASASLLSVRWMRPVIFAVSWQESSSSSNDRLPCPSSRMQTRPADRARPHLFKSQQRLASSFRP